MRIRYKLLLTMVALSSLSVSVSSWLAYQSGKNSLEQAAIRQLSGIRRSRASQIESYFHTVRNHVTSLSNDRMFIEAMQEFSDVYHRLGKMSDMENSRAPVVHYYESTYLPEVRKNMPLRKSLSDYLPRNQEAYWLQNEYIVQPISHLKQGVHQTTSAVENNYRQVHSKYDSAFRQIVEQFGYYDLMLIDLHDLRIIYSVAKEPDLGTSLRVGPYKDSLLSRAVVQAAAAENTDAVFIADFQQYEPSKGAAAAFVASPIFDGKKRVGVFVMQLSTVEMDRVVSGDRGWRRDGLGETGDLAIIGADHRMRSTQRILLEAAATDSKGLHRSGVQEDEVEIMQIQGTNILQMRKVVPAIAEGLAGREGTGLEINSLGKPRITSFMPLNLPGLQWMLLAHIDMEEALAPVRQFQRTAILWSLLTILITVLVALLMTKQLLTPIQSLVAAAQRMSSGDLAARVEVRSKDELGTLSATFNQMAGGIQRSINIIESKNQENENLLLNILPGPIAQRLKSGELAIADSHPQATVLFADIVGFTTFSATRQPAEIISLLNALFTRFDAIARKHGIEKIKTIGDAYMAVSGIPTPHPEHAKRMVETALDMLEAVDGYARELGVQLAVRIGINSGPVAAGVVGTSKFIYDLWGDTVNMASRMESTGLPGTIQVSLAVYEHLKHQYSFEARGAIEVKGKGLCETWLLVPRTRERMRVPQLMQDELCLSKR